MEKIMELYKAVVAYCMANPIHGILILSSLALVLVVLILLIASALANAKKNKKMTNPQEETKMSEILAVETPTENVETQEEPLVEELIASEPVKEEPPVEESIEEEPVIETPTQEEPKTEESTVEAPITVVTPAPAPIVEDKTEEETKPIVKTKAEEKTIKNKVEETQKPIKTKAIQEETMLHDELKDVNTDLDFYEEDETDKVARYSGKWVVCRVVTNDNQEEQTYFFELHASNGEKLLSSEEYTTYNGAIRGIETHKSNILKGNFRITLSKKGDYIFKLLNGKNMLLCMGEHYATKARCESAIESAKRFARTAFVDENVQDVVVKVPTEDPTEAEPIHENYNGKWVIDCNVSPEGDKVYFFELFANNGERLLSSEEYSSYIGAVNGIQTHKMNIKNGNFRISLTKHGDYIYKLLNGNGQLLCLGEHYKTKTRCQNAVESVKKFAANSPILADPELTKE